MVLPFEAIYSTAHLESISAISFSLSLPLLYNKNTHTKPLLWFIALLTILPLVPQCTLTVYSSKRELFETTYACRVYTHNAHFLLNGMSFATFVRTSWTLSEYSTLFLALSQCSWYAAIHRHTYKHLNSHTQRWSTIVLIECFKYTQTPSSMCVHAKQCEMCYWREWKLNEQQRQQHICHY